MPDIPFFLKGYEALYAESPRKATLEWFRNARYGLFMHYGLYSQLGRGEWVMYQDKIRVDEYAKLKDTFSPTGFDARRIAALARDAGMKYVNITTRHHDSFCLWDTNQTDFNSVNSPARRDLVAELAEACREYELGLFLYYSHARDWRHPYFPPNSVLNQTARPAYETPEPNYKWEKDADTETYVRFMHEQLKELLTGYGPIAGVWLDGIMTYYVRPDLFHVADTYALIRSLRPETLVSYKQGATGTEDFYAPEHDPARAKPNKLIEVCTTLTGAWGYHTVKGKEIKSADQVMEMFRSARENGYNVLLNVSPLPDGSIAPEEAAVLREVGRRLRA